VIRGSSQIFRSASIAVDHHARGQLPRAARPPKSRRCLIALPVTTAVTVLPPCAWSRCPSSRAMVCSLVLMVRGAGTSFSGPKEFNQLGGLCSGGSSSRAQTGSSFFGSTIMPPLGARQNGILTTAHFPGHPAGQGRVLRQGVHVRRVAHAAFGPAHAAMECCTRKPVNTLPGSPLSMATGICTNNFHAGDSAGSSTIHHPG